MKRIIVFLIMAIISVIPIYYIVFWEPEETSLVSSVNVEEVEDVIKESANIEKISSEDVNVNLVEEEKVDLKPILKARKEQIEEEMSIGSKKKLKNIVLQLSTVDLNSIEEISKSEDQNQATREIISLLKKRLSVKDYKEIEEILVPYINFDSIY